MSELEDKLGAILSNQDAMSQIMALAQSLGGENRPAPPSPESEVPPEQGQTAPPGGDLLSALGRADPRLISMAMRLAQSYNSNDDSRAALLNALRPFVRPERYANLDKAVQIAKLTRVVRIALNSFRHKGDEDSHV